MIEKTVVLPAIALPVCLPGQSYSCCLTTTLQPSITDKTGGGGSLTSGSTLGNNISINVSHGVGNPT